MWGWLRRSASTFASLGTDTANHCGVSCRARRRSSRMAAAPLDAAFSAAAAGSQSPTAIAAVGCLASAELTASATAHAPNSSAAGMDSTGSWALSCKRARSAARSDAVAAPLASACRAS
eukprot:5931636-Pleurochrysis_carterae.AAC.1